MSDLPISLHEAQMEIVKLRGELKATNDIMLMGMSRLGESILAQDALRKRVEAADALLSRLSRYIPTDTIACNGDKCREEWCRSCYGDEYAEGAMVEVGKDVAALANYRATATSDDKAGGA